MCAGTGIADRFVPDWREAFLRLAGRRWQPATEVFQPFPPHLGCPIWQYGGRMLNGPSSPLFSLAFSLLHLGESQVPPSVRQGICVGTLWHFFRRVGWSSPPMSLQALLPPHFE